MLTANGKNHIRRYLAQQVPVIGSVMVFGTGVRAEVGGDVMLQYEVARNNINLITYDFALNKLIYKATVPENFVGQIYEVGIYSAASDTLAGDFGSREIANFESGDLWVDNTTLLPEAYIDGPAATPAGAGHARIGSQALSHVPALSVTKTSSLKNIVADLTGYSGADYVTAALYVGNTNTASVSLRFMTDASNYYTFTATTAVTTTGYKVLDFLKSTATVTGAPSWANITELRLITTSAASGTSAIEWDGIRVQDNDTANLDYILVARKVIPTPQTKISGQSLDVEFTLDVSV